MRHKLRARKPNGVVLYRGPSLLNGRPIISIAVGLTRKSKNPKTGDMVQVYILANDGEDPIEANRSGGDEAICGHCPHRCGTCYVDISKAPLAIYRAFNRGAYPRFSAKLHLDLFRNRFVRLGSYGDPACVPIGIWKSICDVADGWTGYTHQWRVCDQALSRYCMASCDTNEERSQALAMGWRTFRVRLPEETLDKGEFSCPASKEAGRKKTCAECRACSGSTESRKASPSVIFHGSTIAGNRSLRIFRDAVERISLPLI